MEVNPSWAKGYSRMGTALFRLGQHEKAATAYSKGEWTYPRTEHRPPSAWLRLSFCRWLGLPFVVSPSAGGRPRLKNPKRKKTVESCDVFVAGRPILPASIARGC